MANVMKAPASDVQEIVEVPWNHRELVSRLSPGGRYIDMESDIDSPWVPFGENAAIKHLMFDVRTNTYSNILWMKGPGTIGTHLHRGNVTMVTITGSVRYLEYDWVGTPGGLILEVPGEAHTLVTDHPEGCKLFGWMQGPIDFFDADANFIETVDVWWMISHYEAYCREKGIPINQKLYL